MINMNYEVIFSPAKQLLGEELLPTESEGALVYYLDGNECIAQRMPRVCSGNALDIL